MAHEPPDAPTTLAARVPEPALYGAVAARQRGHRDLPLWLFLAADTGGPVLELGAGTGRVLIPLLEAGVDAQGLELSPERASVGWALLGARRLDPGRLRLGDARRWRAQTPFGLVLATFNLLALFDDDGLAQVLAAAHANLRPGGVFALEAQVWPGPTSRETWETSEPTTLVVGGEDVDYRETLEQPRPGLLRVHRRFGFADGSSRLVVQDLRIRGLTALEAALRAARFEVLLPVLDEHGQPPSDQSRLVFLRGRR